jgi:hypothetical protein
MPGRRYLSIGDQNAQIEDQIIGQEEIQDYRDGQSARRARQEAP